MKGSTKGIIAAVSIIAISSGLGVALVQTKKTQAIDYSLSFSTSSASIQVNQEATLTASLNEISPSKTPISGVKISIQNADTNETIANGITDSNGLYTYTMKFSTTGNYKFVAIATSPLFATGTEVSGNMESGVITISVTAPSPPPEQIEYSLILSASSTSISTGKTVTLTANLESIKPLREELSGATVELIENTTNTEGTATTNSLGNAVFSIEFPDAGTYSFQATYTPNSTKTVKSNIINVTVSGESTPPPTPKYSASLTASTVDTTPDSPVDISVSVKENTPTSENISGASVTVYQNGNEIDSATTGYDGMVSFTLRFSTYGTYRISAKATSSEIGTIDSNTVTIYIINSKTRSPPPPASDTISKTIQPSINEILGKYHLPPRSGII